MPIRPASPAEFPAIEAVLHRAYKPVLDAMPAEFTEIFRDGIVKNISRYAEKGTWFVAGREHQIQGCVAYFPPHSVAHPLFHESWAHIQLLGVDCSHTRRGVGKKLMLHCLSAARSSGARVFALQTSELMEPARKLYESLGFVAERQTEPAFGHPTYLYVLHEI